MVEKADMKSGAVFVTESFVAAYPLDDKGVRAKESVHIDDSEAATFTVTEEQPADGYTRVLVKGQDYPFEGALFEIEPDELEYLVPLEPEEEGVAASEEEIEEPTGGEW